MSSGIKKQSIFIKSAIAAVLFSILILTGCNEDPALIGYSFINDTVSIFPITSRDREIITGERSYRYHAPYFGKGIIEVGKSAMTEAFSLIRFMPPPDMLQSLPTSDIDSCYLLLQPRRYIFGDSTESRMFGFKIYQTVRLFTNHTSWDSIYPGPGPSSFFKYEPLIGQHQGKIDLADSMAPVKIDINSAVVIEWFRWQADSILKRQNYGLALLPDDNCTTLRQFEGATSDTNRPAPLIKVYFTNTEGAPDSLEMKSALDQVFARSQEPDDDYLIVQGLTEIRSELYFDLGFLPNLAGVHRAQLFLTLDPDRSRFGNMPEASTLRADLIKDTTNEAEDAELRYYSGSRIDGGDVFHFPSLTTAIEIWNRTDGKGSLVLRPEGFSNEFEQLDRLAFFGINCPDSTKRPVLKLIYSSRPKLDCDK